LSIFSTPLQFPRVRPRLASVLPLVCVVAELAAVAVRLPCHQRLRAFGATLATPRQSTGAQAGAAFAADKRHASPLHSGRRLIA